MPKFELMPVTEVPLKQVTGKRAEILNEYLGYINKIVGKQAGKLTVLEGETTQTIRRRLGTAAKHAGKHLAVRRVNREIYFWVKPRRGRPPKAN